MLASDDPAFDQTTAFENFEVLRYCGLRDGKVRRESAGGVFAMREPLDDMPPDRIGKCPENPIEHR